MKLNGTIFSKPQQDQLKRALENGGGGGGGGSLTKHVVEMTPANYEPLENDVPKMVSATVDIETQGMQFKGNSFSFADSHIVAQVVDQGDTALHVIGVRLNKSHVSGMYYLYTPSADNSTVSFTDQSSDFMSGNPTFTLTYWTE